MKIYFLAIFLSIALCMKAQEFNAGLRFGMDASQVNGDRLAGFDKAGILAGVFVNRNFSERISVQMEMIFIQKGSRRPLDDFNTYYRLRVHYIEVPVLLRYQASKKFTVYAGPSYGVLIFSEE